LIDLQNSFDSAKTDKFPTKRILVYPPHLKYVAALPWETQQELIRRWDTRTWRDYHLICLLIYHWTTTHLYFQNIFL